MKISIITVTYNSADTIKDTIQSIINQDYSDLEYIIIDGQSTDGTLDIIKEYEPKLGGRLRLLSEPDEGIYDAMNKGIKMATGEIVAVLNADDFYHRNDIISTIAAEFKSGDFDALYADIVFVAPDNTDRVVRYYSAKTFKPGKIRFGFAPPHPSFFTYRKNFEKYGYYKKDYKIAADLELVARFLCKHQLKAKYLPMVLVKMRMGGLSTSCRNQVIANTREQVRACRENGIWTCSLLVTAKFFIKIKGVIMPKLFSKYQSVD